MKRLAVFLATLHGGGAELAGIRMLKGMVEQNISLDLVVGTLEGPYLEQIPKQVRIIDLGAGRIAKSILPLSCYLQQNQPDALISHMGHANVAAVIARKIAGTKTKLALVQQNTLSEDKSRSFRGNILPIFMRWLYPQANAIVGVSTGVAQNLEQHLKLPQGKVNVIYNPVVDQELINKSKSPLDHPWFQPESPPIFLAVGRLTEQKDFSTLIKAFALVRQKKVAKLLILGEGEYRHELEAMIDTFGITDDVSLPGFAHNPYSYMHRASAFILSSRWEGLPTVLIEAMACGCPVVSTDCPSGPREILAEGKYGDLVPTGDSKALATAMLKVLDYPVSKDILVQRAMDFSIDNSVSKYLEVLNSD